MLQYHEETVKITKEFLAFVKSIGGKMIFFDNRNRKYQLSMIDETTVKIQGNIHIFTAQIGDFIVPDETGEKFVLKQEQAQEKKIAN